MEARELLSLHGFDGQICNFIFDWLLIDIHMIRYPSGDNAPVLRGSALAALEGTDTSCVEELMKALDSVPDPERKEVR